MISPPFKLAASPLAMVSTGAGSHLAAGCCDAGDEAGEHAPHGRTRLAKLPPYIHCSVIGTCLSTIELRKIVARHVEIDRARASDLEVHNAAVSLAMEGGPGAKALHKALDERHQATVRKYAKAHGETALRDLWDEARRNGEIPGAYWALLTHPDLTEELRKLAFGDVHMLSHLVGAANRADIRRLQALESENGELRERLERHSARVHELVDERDRAVRELQEHRAAVASQRQGEPEGGDRSEQIQALRAALEEEARQVALQTARREKAEQQAAAAAEESRRLAGLLQEARNEAQAQGRELAAAEAQLQQSASESNADAARLDAALRGRRICYVGGRPGSMPSIRSVVARHGGELLHHDGGLEDRKGLIAGAILGADLAVFPVDCVDHDSAGNLKRLCSRHGIPFVPLRSASVASFLAGLSSGLDTQSQTL